MNQKERERERAFISVMSKEISLGRAAEHLNLSYSHTKRLWSAYKKEGVKGLISKKRGKKSNRVVPIEKRKEMVEIISSKYYGCKPLYTSEKLKDHGYVYSKEFIRQLMIDYHFWVPKAKKRSVHQRRDRRDCEGELVQVDASDHDWFEGRLVVNGRAVKAHLHIFIDDATSTIYGAHFDYEETKEGYFWAAKPYFEKRGIPKALYSDRRSTFKSNSGQKRGSTQFGRAMQELDVEMIYAWTPQAKGRVERAFGTLQDRLVWEMRDRNISTLEEANAFLPEYLELHNNKFAQKPANSFDAHRPLDHNRPLKYILCEKEERIISKNLEVQYKNKLFQIEPQKKHGEPFKKCKVNVITTLEGELEFELNGQLLRYKKYEEIPYKDESLDLSWSNKKSKRQYKPSKYHPWRKFNGFLKKAASVMVALLTI